MTRPIDYGAHVDQTGFERQLDKELGQVLSWVYSTTDMDRAEALAAVRRVLKNPTGF